SVSDRLPERERLAETRKRLLPLAEGDVNGANIAEEISDAALVAHLLRDLQRLLQRLEHFLLLALLLAGVRLSLPEREVNLTHVVERVGYSERVINLSEDGQRFIQIPEGLVRLPQRVVNAPDDMERCGDVSIAHHVAIFLQRPLVILKRPLLVTDRLVNRTDIDDQPRLIAADPGSLPGFEKNFQ